MKKMNIILVPHILLALMILMPRGNTVYAMEVEQNDPLEHFDWFQKKAVEFQKNTTFESFYAYYKEVLKRHEQLEKLNQDTSKFDEKQLEALNTLLKAKKAIEGVESSLTGMATAQATNVLGWYHMDKQMPLIKKEHANIEPLKSFASESFFKKIANTSVDKEHTIGSFIQEAIEILEKEKPNANDYTLEAFNEEKAQLEKEVAELREKEKQNKSGLNNLESLTQSLKEINISLSKILDSDSE